LTGEEVRRVTDRDETFSAFVAARSPHLLRTAYLLTGDRGQAEDLVQTALAKTYLAWDRIADIDAVEAYVRRTMITTNISWWRRRRVRELSVAEVPDAPTWGDEADLAVERESLWRLLEGLPPKQRTALVLRYWAGLSEAEIAYEMKCAPGTVKTHASRGLAALRESLTAATTLDASGGERA
jgi:RNA polymerase sigma-70 factor (sigma-E family)